MVTGWSVLGGVLGGAALLVLPARRCWSRRIPLSALARSARSAGAAGATRTAATPRAASAEDVLALIELVAAQVRAGASPLTAWRAAGEVLHLPAAARTDPLDWWAAIARCERRPPGGRPVAAAAGTAVAAAAASAAWRLAERTGAPLADALDGVAAAVRDELAVAGQVEVALAGPRATVRLLTWLPVAGLLLGQAIGASPVPVLLGTPVGRVCAAAGVGLLLAGRWWMRRLVAQVESAR